MEYTSNAGPQLATFHQIKTKAAVDLSVKFLAEHGVPHISPVPTQTKALVEQWATGQGLVLQSAQTHRTLMIDYAREVFGLTGTALDNYITLSLAASLKTSGTSPSHANVSAPRSTWLTHASLEAHLGAREYVDRNTDHLGCGDSSPG